MSEQDRRLLLGAAAGAGALLALRALLRHSRTFDFRDKVVLITGGSRGLGLVLAREAAREGACVALCARDADELDRARHDLQQAGARVVTVPGDVTDRDQVAAVARQVRSHFGRIDVLVNNAGVIQAGPLEVMTLEDYEEALKVHYWAPLYTMLEVIPEMRHRGEGRIVNIASVGGKVSVPHLVPYCGSKFALVGLSEGFRAELARDGIVVTTVCPGLMRTGSPVNAFFKGRHRAEYAWFILGDSLPLISQDARRAARQILRACQRGDAEVVLGLPTKLAVTFHDLFPGLTADLLALANRFLPRPGGIGSDRATGRQSESPVTRSPLTVLTRRAARHNNQLSST